MKVKEEAFGVSNFEEKGLKAQGVRLNSKESISAQLGVTRLAKKAAKAAAQAEELFTDASDRSMKSPRTAGAAKYKAKTKAAASKNARGSANYGVRKPGSAETPKKGLKARAEAIAAKGKAASHRKQATVRKATKKK
jgi:hypothetical protein